MKKIGFRIYRFKEGPSIGLTVNEGDWTKKVVDIRDILKLYDTEDETKFAMFLSFSESGAYITLARAISGRAGDNTAAWIYIPNSIEVSDADILPIIEVVKEELSASKGNTERLTQLFSKEYREIEKAAYMPSSPEMIFAKRNDVFYPLKDILGKKLYQPIYSNYHAILIETQNGMEVVDKNVIDITTQPLAETLVFCPPVASNLPHGVTVHFNSPGHPQFKQPIRKNKGEIVELIFNRRGFESIPFMTSVEENNQICGMPRFDWKKVVSRDFFKVVATHNPKINLTHDAVITVNNKELKWHQPISLSEGDARQGVVRVSVNGYEPVEEYLDLLSAETPITIKLQRAERAQNWKIELANGHVAEMSLRSKYLSGNKNESPLEGYSREDGVLRYTNFGVLKQRTIGFLMAVATFVVICIGIALYQWVETHNFKWQLGWPILKVEKIDSYKIPSSQTVNPSLDTNDTTATSDQANNEVVPSLSKAITYLDSNEVWERDGLIEYPELEGLFEELNSYNFNKILDRETTLGDSKQFMEVVKKIRQNVNKTFNGNFCAEGDYQITIKKYMDKLDRSIEESQRRSGIGKDSAMKTQPEQEKSKTSNRENINKTSKKNSNRGGV